jgi:hypothetical protein
MNIANTVAAFSEKFGVLFRPASPTEIASAATAGIPESLLEFYREFEPNEEGSEEIRFFSLERVVAGLTDFVPSCHLSRHGYFAIAGTNHGDVYVVRPIRDHDYWKMPVYLFGHEIDFSRISATQVEEFGTIVASGVPDFLSKAAAGQLETNPFNT